MDGIHGGEPGMMHYLQDQNHNGLHHHHMSNGNAIDQDEHGENNNIGTSGGVDEVMDGDVGANMGSQTDNGALIPHVGGSENGDQLTLSFQGQVYVFDSVSPEKVDRISLLPDEVLVSILCLLSFKEATATSILGRRWRYLHTWTRKLDLDGSELLTKQGQMSCKTLMNWFNELRCDDYFTWADCLMAKHNNSTLEEFRVFYGLDRSNAQHLDEWLRFALSKRVERLELNLTWKGHVDLRNHHAYTFPYKRVVGEGFSFLKKLSTSYVNVGGEAVEGLLRNCPHLQQLSLDQPGDLTSLEIVSTFPSFKRLEICLCLSLTSLVIRDSSIVCLRVYTGIRIQHVALTNVPLLTELTLGNLPLVDLGDMFSSVLPQIRMLELFIDRIDLSEEESRNFCSRIELSNLKQFVVVDDGRNDLKEIVVGDEGRVETPLTPLIHLLNASPRLEKFVVKRNIWMIGNTNVKVKKTFHFIKEERFRGRRERQRGLNWQRGRPRRCIRV